ncbi:MAG: hypothetical protein QM813_00655 [Verrucomicrobiota bacterium]
MALVIDHEKKEQLVRLERHPMEVSCRALSPSYEGVDISANGVAGG